MNRRELLRRAAAAGLFVVPGVAALSSCASGGGDGNKQLERGEMTPDNPFGVLKDEPLDVVVFKGGFGDEYAKQWEALYADAWDAEVTHLGTTEITGKLQPRFNSGNPPDVVDNSGAQSIKLDVLHGDNQLTDLTELLESPSVDDPSKTVAETLIPGTAEQGFFGGKMHALNYVYTIWGLWYSDKLFQEQGWTAPTTWADFIAIMEDAKSQGIGGLAHQGQHPYYMNIVIMDLIAKTGGLDSMRAIDNLDPQAFVGSDAAQQAIEAVYEIVQKGLLMPGTNGLDHIDSQTRWNEGDAVFIPSGSWLENEQLKSTPEDFQMTFLPTPVLPGSAMEAYAVRAGAGEAFIVPAKAHNPAGGLEFLRQMLSREWSTTFAKEVSSLSIVEGAVDPSVKLRPGITSALAAVDACPIEDRFHYLYTEWYSEMDESIRNATAELMADRINPDQWLRTAQAAVDKAAEDPASEKNKRD
jgi:N-acetylglucosamine transport system substrate-binding protein